MSSHLNGVIVTAYQTANSMRVQMDVRDNDGTPKGGALVEFHRDIHIRDAIKFRNEMLERLSETYDRVIAPGGGF